MCFLCSQDFFWQIFKNKKWLLSGNTDQLSRVRPEYLQPDKQKQITDLPSCAPLQTVHSVHTGSVSQEGEQLAVYYIHLEGDGTGLLYLAQQWKANGTQECCHSGEVLCSQFSKPVILTPYFSLYIYIYVCALIRKEKTPPQALFSSRQTQDHREARCSLWQCLNSESCQPTGISKVVTGEGLQTISTWSMEKLLHIKNSLISFLQHVYSLC